MLSAMKLIVILLIIQMVKGDSRGAFLSKNGLTTLSNNMFKNSVNLTYVVLDRNNLTELPKGLFRNNKELIEIDLSFNNLSEIPYKLFSGLKKLKNLKLARCNFKKLPSAIQRVRTLKYLSMSSNKIETIPEGYFAKLKAIRYLKLRNNSISYVGENTFTNLELLNLDLSNNHIKNEEWIYKLFAVRELHLGHNEIQQLPFMNLTNLRVLDVSYNLISYIHENTFNNLELNLLDLSNNRIKYVDCILRLSRVYELYLQNNDIQEFPIWNKMELDILNISSNKLNALQSNTFELLQFGISIYLNSCNPKALPAATQYLKNLHILQVNNNSITTIPHDYFNNLTSVKMLTLNNNNISSIQQNAFSKLIYMHTLEISHNNLSDMNWAASLPGLVFLRVPHNRITQIPKLNLPNLHELDISYNNIINVGTQFPEYLYKLKIGWNPLECNCLMRTLVVLKKRKIECDYMEKECREVNEKSSVCPKNQGMKMRH